MENTKKNKVTSIVCGAATGFLAGGFFQLITLHNVLHLPMRSVLVGAAITAVVWAVAGGLMNYSIHKNSKKEDSEKAAK